MLYTNKIILDREFDGLGYFFAFICKLGKSKFIIAVEILIKHLALLAIDADKIQSCKPVNIRRYI